MGDDRWRRVEQLYHGALERPPRERAEWLAAACGEDAPLRQEVDVLLQYDCAGAAFLEEPALAVEARALAREREREMTGRRLGGYEILELIGTGGMGEVYRARDVRLQREVALKVFEHAATRGPMVRLEAEARAASALNHPNIVTIYGIGEQGDTAYIAMELVVGRSLREQLREGTLPVPQVVTVALQLAEAIAAAHARGIVHRDLKPENVMITPDGRVKVLDFGIATLLHDRRSAGAEGSAAPAALVGTMGYMSPEQARGEHVGPPSDQYSFGVICHEMVTGARPPYESRPADGPRRESVRRRAGVRGDRLAPLGDVIARCLSTDPDGRFGDAADLVAALRRVQQELGRGSVPRRPTRRQVLALGGIAAAGAVSGAAAFQWWPGGPVHRSLAVLPFDNPVRDENTEYLCDGITETLIRQLARLPQLTVIARATAFTFKGAAIDPLAIGRRLGVDATLTGAVTRRAGRVLISAELTDSAKGTLLWGGHFDRRAGDVLAVQDAIAEAILVEGIGMALTSAQRQRLALAFSGDPTAYELFLLAVHHLRLGSEDDYLTARRLLQRAVERDPRFALAHVTLASSYSVMAIDGYVAPAEAWPESERHVARAIAIDADLADAHAEAAASAFFYRWNWDEAEREWGLALRMRNELQSELLSAYALQKWASGQPRAALELAQAARQVDPLSPQASIREADLLAAVGRVEEAIAAYERVVRELPGDPRAHAGLAEAWRRQGRFDQAIRHLRVAHGGGGPSFDALFERARGAAGYDEIVREAAREELRQLEERRRAGSYVSALDLARAFARLGDAVRAFDQLGAALDERAAGLALLAVDPAWNQLRGDPRFAAAVARVGIPRLVTARAAAATGEGRRSL